MRWQPGMTVHSDTVHRHDEFLRAAHYFADGWPLDSLLVMRNPSLRRDLRQLRRDGYNAIIVVVPWRGFQVSQAPIAYDPFYGNQLRLVLDEARGQGLAVLLRVAYSHQILHGPSVGPIRRTQAMLVEPELRAAWMDYHREVHAIAASYSCCRGTFLSWEELWHAYTHFQSQSLKERQQAATALGYDRFEEGDDAFPPVIPEPGAPGSARYHRFVNHHMVQLFEEVRSHCPLLGVEYRVDRDAVVEGDETRWVENPRFLDWEPARYSYWAPFMYAENIGETLDAPRALASLGTMLDETGVNGAYPGQVLEQFNFIENTREYQGRHAKIDEAAIGDFLAGAAPLLVERCGGYGIWAPRDYRCNVLYNSAFLDGARGWDLDAASRVDDQGVTLNGGATLQQQLEPRIAWIPRMHPFESLRLELRVRPGLLPRGRRLRARLNGGEWATLEREGRGLLGAQVPIDFDGIPADGLRFELENQGTGVTVQRVQLYHLSYAMGLRDHDGRAGPFLPALRRFNAALRKLDAGVRGQRSQR